MILRELKGDGCQTGSLTLNPRCFTLLWRAWAGSQARRSCQLVTCFIFQLCDTGSLWIVWTCLLQQVIQRVVYFFPPAISSWELIMLQESSLQLSKLSNKSKVLFCFFLRSCLTWEKLGIPFLSLYLAVWHGNFYLLFGRLAQSQGVWAWEG